ncbi:hypothetical protein TNCV_2068891 [Trichonephila clavipes]|uniref:Uncharacterized protein n=1 Tax=Trichonephila clavipes TaxID=2585209 RepID=A0A8X6W3F2_TRICX|nr:hypothetical protein TNCV_2068891 [Trichonephila clavipes]
MDEILTTARDLELEVNENDKEELIMGHGDELTIEELQEILNEEHQETQLRSPERINRFHIEVHGESMNNSDGEHSLGTGYVR